MQDSQRDTDIKNRLLDSVGEGEGGMIWENSIETCILSYVKQITSPSSMHETGCSGLVHWDDLEGWDGDTIIRSFMLGAEDIASYLTLRNTAQSNWGHWPKLTEQEGDRAGIPSRRVWPALGNQLSRVLWLASQTDAEKGALLKVGRLLCKKLFPSAL